MARALKGLQPNNLNEVVSFSTTPVRDLPFYRKLNIPAGRALNFKPLQVTQEKWLTQYDAVKAEQLSVAGYLRRGRLDADTQKKLQDYQIELNRSEADLTSMANDLNDLTADNVKLTHLLNQANKKLSEGLPRRPIEILLKYQGQSERFVNGLVGVEQANGEYRLTYDHTIACSLPFSAWVDNVSLEQAAVDTEDWKSFTPIGSFTLRYDGNNPYVPLKHGSIDAREKARTKDGAVELHFIQRWQSGGVKKGFVFNDKNDAQPVIRTFYQGVKSLKYRFVIVDTRGDRHYVPFENLNIESAKAAAQKAAAKK